MVFCCKNFWTLREDISNMVASYWLKKLWQTFNHVPPVLFNAPAESNLFSNLCADWTRKKYLCQIGLHCQNTSSAGQWPNVHHQHLVLRQLLNLYTHTHTRIKRTTLWYVRSNAGKPCNKKYCWMYWRDWPSFTIRPHYIQNKLVTLAPLHRHRHWGSSPGTYPQVLSNTYYFISYFSCRTNILAAKPIFLMGLSQCTHRCRLLVSSPGTHSQ